MELKEFDKFDWYGMAGAEPFADGSEPLIGHATNESGESFTIVVDAHGVQVIFQDDVILDYQCKPELAKLIGKDLDPHYITPGSLEALGFKRIN